MGLSGLLTPSEPPGDSVPGYCGELPGDIGALLLAAAETLDDKVAERLLLQAQEQGPEYLAVYLGLYKFYFYRQRFPEAERWMRHGLALSARLGGVQESDNVADFADPLSPGRRFHLFTHKALAFALLRQGQRDEALQLLTRLHELDPHNRIGADLVFAAAGCDWA